MVMGHMGDKSEWSIGEASPSNNKNQLPICYGREEGKGQSYTQA